MKKSLSILFAVIGVMCFFYLPKAHAVGFGLYGSGGGGTADWTPDWNDIKFRKSTRHFSYGFALDTAPASDRLFNYNLNIGYDKFINRNSNAWGDVDLEGVVVSNNFGFGGLITPNIRLWFGPELRLSWSEGSPDNFPNFTIRTFGIGIGPTLGVNFNVGDRLTLVLKGGYQFINYYGYGQGWFNHATNDASSSNRFHYDTREKLFYVLIEVLARTSDTK